MRKSIIFSFFSGILFTVICYFVVALIMDIPHGGKLVSYIGYKDAQAMFDNRNAFFTLKSKPKYIWFSYGEVDSFLKNSLIAIKDTLPKDSNTEDSKLDTSKIGVRIYFAAYTNEYYPDYEVKNGWKNRRTIFFVPTYRLNNTSFINYDIINKKTDSFGAFLIGGSRTAMNHGTLCPPEENCIDDKGSAFLNNP